MDIKPATGRLIDPATQLQLVGQEGTLAQLKNASEKALVAARTVLTALPKAGGGEWDRVALEHWLRKTLHWRLDPDATFYLGDREYYLPTPADIQQIWVGSELGNLIYKTERFDCDDFAFAFKGQSSRYAYLQDDWELSGICAGVVSATFSAAGSSHAAGIYVAYENKSAAVKFFEPATGKPYPDKDVGAIRAVII